MVVSKAGNGEKTVVGFSVGTGIAFYGVFGAIGLILGFFLPRIIAWALTLPAIPFRGPLEVIESFSGPWLHVILVLIGLAAGLIIAYIGIRERLILTMTNEKVQLDIDGKKQIIAKDTIDTIFFDGKQLVILGTSGYELAREKNEVMPEKVVRAFKKHGYPFSEEGDPFKGDYRRWVEDTPDISPAANALMKAREKAIEKKEKDEINDLRHELAKLGYIVRDDGKRQYWRRVQSM